MYEFVMDYAENDELLGAVVSIVGTNLEVILCHFNLISTILDDFDIDMDEIGEEIILKLGRLQISLELEEFASVFLEMEEASSLVHKMLLSKIQYVQNNEEIN